MIKQFSPNMLKTFEFCPRKFSFRYRDNISMPADNDIFEFGKNIHALASYYLKGCNIDKMENSLSVKELEVWNYLKNLKYFNYDVIGTEYNLAVKVSDNFYSGRLDALVKDSDKYYILDYKTGAVPENAKYDFQTMIYLLAVQDFFKTDKIDFVYIDLKKRKEIFIEFNSDLANEYRQKLIQTTKQIKSSELFPKKKNCTCEYDKICF